VRPIAIVMPTCGLQDAERVMAEAQKMAGVETVPIISHDPEQTGFTRNTNRGLRQVPDGHDVMILNDDVEGFYLGWLKTLRDGLYSRDDIGLIGPSGDCSTLPMALAPKGGEGMESVGWFPLWCALIRREAFDAVGLLDERYIHYASDCDYGDRMRSAGWLVVWHREVVLTHITAGSKTRRAWAGHDISLYELRKRRQLREGTWPALRSL